MFHTGTLVVTLPSAHTGGALEVRHEGETVRFDSAYGDDGPAPSLSIKQMKQTISEAGLAVADLLEKQDVVARYAQAKERLAEAEARVHGTSIDEVHFHEVGALDSIADIVGAAACVVHLGLDRIHCSALSLGSGSTRGAHGPIPIPAPAVLEVLTGVAPMQAGPAPFESTTPTGAAVLATIVDTWCPMPPMTVTAVGKGAGGRDSDQVANVLRLVLGSPA